MFYIQRRSGRDLETIDQFETRKEATDACHEYNLADKSAYHYVSRSACKAYKQS